MNKNLLIILFLIATVSTGKAEEVLFVNGTRARGAVLGEANGRLILQEKYGTFEYPLGMIVLVRSDEDADALDPISSASSLKRPKIFPDLVAVLSKLVKEPWGKGIQQIPATVVDVGPMKYVPYTSYRCNQDYEINVYGDPDNPSGVEIGIYRDLLKKSEAKENCIQFIMGFLKTEKQKTAFKAMHRSQDSVTVDGVTIDITPETAEDAYGGWWVTIYNQEHLDADRATPQEINQITQSKDAQPTKAGSDELLQWTNNEMGLAKPSSPQTNLSQPAKVINISANPKASPTSSVPTNFSRTANPSTQSNSPPPSTPPKTNSGGTVYVKGYYRKDGTYVHSYTRSAPKKK